MKYRIWFQANHLVPSFKGTEVVAESPEKAAISAVSESGESDDMYTRNGVHTVLVVGSRLNMFEVCLGKASKSFGGGA